MRYFPVFLDLKGKSTVVVGGGRVGERKAKTLLRAGARVKVVAPELTAGLERLRDRGKITHLRRIYRAGDLKGAVLAIAATGKRSVNEAVFRRAARSRILINVVDDPAHSSFIVPSVVEKKSLILAISTSGKSPALARYLRQKLEKEIGPEYAVLLDFLSKLRKELISRGWGQKENQRIFRALLKGDLLSLAGGQGQKKLSRRLENLLGPGFRKE